MSDSSELRPTEDDWIAWIREASELIEREDFVVKASDEVVFKQLWGICVQAIRHARAYVLLVDADFEREAMVLARAALEHAVTAQWAFHRHDGLSKLRVSMVRGEKENIEMVGEWFSDAGLLATAAAISVPQGRGLPSFTDMMRDLDEERFLENSYGSLSLAVHVRASTQTSYFAGSADDLVLRHVPAHALRGPATNMAAMAAMLAVAVIMELVDDQEALSRINEESERLILPPTLRPGIPETKRRPGPGENTPW
ncbi:hypothetical protein [Leifsonia shinshuensis]|uniref:Uncharacterized protein n=1 Tax=Leifsonia shinshuensis TaxID=150026 RepID=A0A7G6YHH3_9MICO|nr:hypothetical protein [Leifsonia shinshuensis]QNE37938.1 hypothetical protein F1C12_21895 [Leifsonia shinshuensis]